MKCALSLAASAIGVAEAWRWCDTLPGEPRETERYAVAIDRRSLTKSYR